ncbi:hypothetical protein KC853_01785 [Candidatus Saccharibacteria bacterium]|nr:hypothetical protein [Candidatus Saccharibacteria bacterium]MCB9834595.1 hypothetical protein [Candidatus Nomurabacteria bacterium]
MNDSLRPFSSNPETVEARVRTIDFGNDLSGSTNLPSGVNILTTVVLREGMIEDPFMDEQVGTDTFTSEQLDHLGEGLWWVKDDQNNTIYKVRIRVDKENKFFSCPNSVVVPYSLADSRFCNSIGFGVDGKEGVVWVPTPKTVCNMVSEQYGLGIRLFGASDYDDWSLDPRSPSTAKDRAYLEVLAEGEYLVSVGDLDAYLHDIGDCHLKVFALLPELFEIVQETSKVALTQDRERIHDVASAIEEYTAILSSLKFIDQFPLALIEFGVTLGLSPEQTQDYAGRVIAFDS